MVETLSIKKIRGRDKLVVDTAAVMESSEDFDFKPRARIENGHLILFCDNDGSEFDRVELDAGMVEIAERDRAVDMRVNADY